MIEKIKQAYLEARKSNEGIKKNVLQMILNKIEVEEIEKKRSLTGEEVLQQIQREKKQVQETLKFAEKSGRAESIKEEKEKLAIIGNYLPKQLTKEEILNIVKELGLKNRGEIMKAVMGEYKNQVSGKELNEVVTEYLKSV